MKKLLQQIAIIYSSISLVGCVTPKAIEYIDESAETVTHHWKIESIDFAAIKDNRYVRMCIAFSSPTDKTTTELAFDLEQISNTLVNMNAETVDLENVSSGDSAFCNRDLEEDEQSLPVLEMYSDAPDITEALYALYPEPLDTPAVTLLHHESERYLVFGAPMDLYENLDNHAYDSYTQTEKRHSPGTALVIIPAILADAVIISAMAVLILICLIPPFTPFCFFLNP